MPTRIATLLPDVAGSFNVYNGNKLVARLNVYDKGLASLDTLEAMHKATGMALKERKRGEEQQQACPEKQEGESGGKGDDVPVRQEVSSDVTHQE